jgi:hypothetical protein
MRKSPPSEDAGKDALRLSPRVVILLRLAFLESDRRTHIPENCGLQRVLCFRKRLPMMHRADWQGRRASSGMTFAWFDGDRNHRRPLARHLGGGHLRHHHRCLGGGHHRQRERDRAVEGAIVNAPSHWMPTECGIASAIPEFLCRVPPTAGCPSLTPATWSPEKEESHVHIGRCKEARSQDC